MSHRCLAAVFTVIVGVALSAIPAAAQTAPRTPWGQPDLQGIWDFRTITPIERPEELGDQEFLTEEEAANLQQEAVDRDIRLWEQAARRTEAGDNVGGYNNFWMDRGTTTIETRRTSLVVDPPNGRVPDLSPVGQRRTDARQEYLREHPADSWLELNTSDRCIVGFNAGPPITPLAYNQNMQLFQTPDHVVVFTEMVHTARVVPLDGRPALNDGIRLWSGDSRGHWEGDTLVVETANFNDERTVAPHRLRARRNGVDREHDADRTLHPRGRGHARVHVHGDRPGDVDEPVDGVDADARDRRADVRVRVSRGELQLGGHPRWNAGRREGRRTSRNTRVAVGFRRASLVPSPWGTSRTADLGKTGSAFLSVGRLWPVTLRLSGLAYHRQCPRSRSLATGVPLQPSRDSRFAGLSARSRRLETGRAALKVVQKRARREHGARARQWGVRAVVRVPDPCEPAALLGPCREVVRASAPPTGLRPLAPALRSQPERGNWLVELEGRCSADRRASSFTDVQHWSTRILRRADAESDGKIPTRSTRRTRRSGRHFRRAGPSSTSRAHVIGRDRDQDLPWTPVPGRLRRTSRMRRW